MCGTAQKNNARIASREHSRSFTNHCFPIQNVPKVPPAEMVGIRWTHKKIMVAIRAFQVNCTIKNSMPFFKAPKGCFLYKNLLWKNKHLMFEHKKYCHHDFLCVQHIPTISPGAPLERSELGNWETMVCETSGMFTGGYSRIILLCCSTHVVSLHGCVCIEGL